VYAAIEAAREAGFDNLNLDMMFALPGQDFADWEADLREAIAAGPEHISTYCLSFEEDTPLWLRLIRGQTGKRGEAEEAEYYERTWDILGAQVLLPVRGVELCTGRARIRPQPDTWRIAGMGGGRTFGFEQLRRVALYNVPSLDAWLAGLQRGSPELVDMVEA
jgi:oxygen-independent coproporphyrinogen-3 oxidase